MIYKTRTPPCRPLRTGRFWWLAPLCLLGSLACFNVDQPVDERLLLSFLEDGGLRIRLSVELRHPEAKESSPLTRRLRQLEDELLGGLDPWPDRFGRPQAPVESFYWEKEEGRLVYLERNLVLDDPAALTMVLRDTPIQATYTVEDGVAELALFPGLAGRATRRERREMARVLDEWSEALAAYFQTAEDLYRYLETRPDRAVPCFGAIFEDSQDEYGDLLPEEEELIEALGDASGEILEVLDTDEKREYTLDELSRRVFDPFPARFEVEIPAAAREVEGFVRGGDAWIVPGLSLWTTFEHLEGEWLTPDPVIAWVAHQRSAPDDTPFDVAGFAARERLAFAPYSRAIRDALEAGLAPADLYRVTWRAPEVDMHGQ